MKNLQIIILLLPVLMILVRGESWAGTTISVTSLVADSIDTGDIDDEIQNKSDLNGPTIADSFAMANISGYPIGKSSIGSFPHMQIGLSLAAGLTNMEYFDNDSTAKDEGHYPGISPNPVLHFGMGIAGGFDFIGKFFYLAKAFADPGVESDIISLSNYQIISVGGKLRYNIIKEKTLLPFLLKFGGITVSLGGDVMYGDFKLEGNYDATLDDIDVEAGGSSHTISTDFSGDYEARVLWGLISVTTQAVAYMDVLYLFSFYSGFGLTFNYGYFRFDFEGAGDLTTDNEEYKAANSNDDNVGSILFESRNIYNPYFIIPTYILGLEINLSVVKLTGETMVNLYNLSDVNAQIGIRVQL